MKRRYMDEPRSRVIGLMSGTSVDSIDAALCDLWEEDGRIRTILLGFHEHPMPIGLRERIFRVFEDGVGSLSLTCSLNFEIGNAFADAALALIEKTGIPRESVTAIASHGQTAYHIAPHMVQGRNESGNVASTLQIGEPSIIAQRTGLP
ncbi:MAG TPA: anhydro-N-acetylmuramic acid kinase, partial [bacterium]|nr:anhydro-N-acetylmuramic acid kinase [bacterium]